MSPTDVFTTMLHGVDTLDWDTVRSSFAERVDVDYTELWGGEAATVPIDDLVSDWTELATGFDATQHLTGPIAVVADQDADRIDGVTTFRAYHHVIEAAGASTWLVVGRYDIGLEPENRHRGGDDPQDVDSHWRIRAITLHLAYEEGDRGLVDLARKRSRAGEGGRAG